jgi:hypothetical protein
LRKVAFFEPEKGLKYSAGRRPGWFQPGSEMAATGPHFTFDRTRTTGLASRVKPLPFGYFG